MDCEVALRPVAPYPSRDGLSPSDDMLSPPGESGVVATRPTDRKPDADAIKMFVGQVPKAWDEVRLREMFGEFGQIYELNVLRDRATGQSRGCCFVTYYTRKAALEAQNALHNIKTLSGMHHPIQMKPADTEGKNVEERKLFIGMIPKHYSEDDVRSMFSSFGSIEECKILREVKDARSRGKSKGCAFITYTKRASCVQAIKSMNNSRTLEGCSAPLAVKFADTQKDKEKRLKLIEELTNNQGPVCPELLQACKDLLMQHSGLTVYPSVQAPQNILRTTAGTGVIQTSHDPTHPHLISLMPATQNTHQAVTKTIGIHPAMHSIPAPTAYTTDLSGNFVSAIPGVTAHHNLAGYGSAMVATGHPISTDTISQAYTGLQHYTAQLSQYVTQSTHSTLNGSSPPSLLGPDGSNLFIYHLPQEFTDSDLIQMFAPFGTIVSAKVFVDKQTNMSKCFGFVSYDTVSAAHRAIQSMNGFQVGSKRLKVQLKRSKAESSKPY